MPSPIAHGLLGLSCGLGLLAHAPRRWWGLVLIAFVGLGCSPDVDYLPGLFRSDLSAWHHVYTHSISWGALVTLGAWLVWRALEPAAGWPDLLWIALAVGSHLAADWTTEDRSAPFGIMLAWPLSESYSTSSVAVFAAMDKDTLWSILQWNNLQPAVRELMIALPPVLISAMWWKRSVSLRAKATTR